MNALFLKIVASGVLVVGLCQCQSDVTTPHYRIIETKEVTYGGRYFFEEHRLVGEHPFETQVVLFPR